LLLLLIISIRLIGDNLYDYPENPALPQISKETVIVCLAGGKHRIEAAYALFADGVGSHLFVVGAGKKATAQGLARLQGAEVAQKIPWDRFDRIEVETESKNTIENAFAVKRYLEQNPQVKSILLITSSYHMRRARMMIAEHISADVNIVPYTPPAAEIERGNWWHSWLGISMTVVEYVKLQLAKVLMPALRYF
jgi:uncharacterized SAM-binding protein YcdF (DUF218 family)